MEHGEQTLMLVVEKGMPDGHEISMISEGDQRPGNINIRVCTSQNPRRRAWRCNLCCEHS